MTLTATSTFLHRNVLGKRGEGMILTVISTFLRRNVLQKRGKGIPQATTSAGAEEQVPRRSLVKIQAVDLNP